MRIVGNTYAVGNAVKLVESLALHGVTQPAANIALLVNPRQCVGHINATYAVHLQADLSRSRECNTLLFGACGQRLDELEDVARQGLCDAKSRKFHEDIDDLLFLWEVGNAVDIAVSEQGISFPLAVVETQ